MFILVPSNSRLANELCLLRGVDRQSYIGLIFDRGYFEQFFWTTFSYSGLCQKCANTKLS